MTDKTHPVQESTHKVDADAKAAVKDAEKALDEAQGDLEPAGKALAETVSKEQEQGYRGVAVDPVPNDAYTLRTGPNSPTTYADNNTRLHQPTLPKEVNH